MYNKFDKKYLFDYKISTFNKKEVYKMTSDKRGIVLKKGEYCLVLAMISHDLFSNETSEDIFFSTFFIEIENDVKQGDFADKFFSSNIKTEDDYEALFLYDFYFYKRSSIIDTVENNLREHDKFQKLIDSNPIEKNEEETTIACFLHDLHEGLSDSYH